MREINFRRGYKCLIKKKLPWIWLPWIPLNVNMNLVLENLIFLKIEVTRLMLHFNSSILRRNDRWNELFNWTFRWMKNVYIKLFVNFFYLLRFTSSPVIFLLKRGVLSTLVIVYNQAYNESETDLLTFKFRSIMVMTLLSYRRPTSLAITVSFFHYEYSWISVSHSLCNLSSVINL